MSELTEIINAIKRFRDDRDWKQFHDSKNLAISLSVESAELLENFLWKSHEDVDRNKVRNELADVFYSAFLIADNFDLDVKQIILDKLQQNEAKYPVEKSKGSSKKYNEL